LKESETVSYNAQRRGAQRRGAHRINPSPASLAHLQNDLVLEEQIHASLQFDLFLGERGYIVVVVAAATSQSTLFSIQGRRRGGDKAEGSEGVVGSLDYPGAVSVLEQAVVVAVLLQCVVAHVQAAAPQEEEKLLHDREMPTMPRE